MAARGILSPLPWATQMEISQAFWSSTDRGDLRPFFHYFNEQCHLIYHTFGGRIPLQSEVDVKFIATLLRQDLSRSSLIELLETRNPQIYKSEAMEGAIDLVARLMTMLDVGRFPDTSFSGRRRLTWDGGSLKEFLGEIFTVQVEMSHEGVKLGNPLTVRNLDRIGGLGVRLTSNLADHLLLLELPEKDDILIFHHASFLFNQSG